MPLRERKRSNSEAISIIQRIKSDRINKLQLRKAFDVGCKPNKSTCRESAMQSYLQIPVAFTSNFADRLLSSVYLRTIKCIIYVQNKSYQYFRHNDSVGIKVR